MKITIRDLQKKIPINPKRIKKTILKVLSQEGIKRLGEITVCFANDKKIRELNLRFLHKNSATDVLAFDGSTALTINPERSRRIDMFGTKYSGQISADIIISTDTAVRNAKIFKTTPLFEVYLYAVHGMLHLLGYNDKTTKQIKTMTARTETILSTLNISRKAGSCL